MSQDKRAEEVWALLPTMNDDAAIDMIAAYGAECRAQGVREMATAVEEERNAAEARAQKQNELYHHWRTRAQAEQQRREAAEARVRELREITVLFIKGAEKQKGAMDYGWGHALICNYQHNTFGGKFCNCGVTDIQYALSRAALSPQAPERVATDAPTMPRTPRGKGGEK
jgi:hypothetical protein